MPALSSSASDRILIGILIDSNIMTFSRTPSPNYDRGWSTPGLSTPYESSSRQPSPNRLANGSSRGVTWESAQMKSAKVISYPSVPSNGSTGFFRRGLRKLSVGLPQFANDRKSSKQEKIDLRERLSVRSGSWRNFLSMLGRRLWRLRLQFTLILGVLAMILLFYITRG